MQTNRSIETRKTTAAKPSQNPAARRRLIVDVVLWTVATIVMLASAVYQERTGPTYPLRGSLDVQGTVLKYKLPRSHGGEGDQMVSLADPGEGVEGQLLYRRFKQAEDFTEVRLARDKGKLSGALPHQPPAGKLEYFIKLYTPNGEVTVPSGNAVVIRFRGAVPAWALIPHIIFMFFGMLFCVRTGFEVLQPNPRLRRLAWYSLGLLGLGGMLFGPIVQKYAFGAYWTGVPFGWDLTDNKVLIMVLAWIGAVIVLGLPKRPIKPLARWLVLLAALITLVVYLIPHSMYGSELDYKTGTVKQG